MTCVVLIVKEQLFATRSRHYQDAHKAIKMETLQRYLDWRSSSSRPPERERERESCHEVPVMAGQ